MTAYPDPPTTPSAARSSTATGARSTAGDRGGGGGVCAFDLPAGRFGLDVAMVGEVVQVERVLAVPRAPRGVLGLFNLRGAAVALIDLAVVLDMPGPRPAATDTPLALVLRTGAIILGAIQVTAVVTVIPPAAATLVAADRQVDHAAIAGFVRTPATGVVSVLDSVAIHQRLATLRSR